jgi:hypothetical protein
MNSITDKYLAENPGVDGNDATWQLGRENPELLKDPAFAADFQAELEYRKSTLSPADYAKQFAGSAIRGVADVVAGIPEGAATLVSKPAAAMERLIPIDGDGGAEAGDPTQSLVYKAGRLIRTAGEKLSPDRVEALDDSFWVSKVPGGLGSAAGFMAGGAAGAALKIPATLGVAGMGALSSGASAWKEAKAAGASEDDAYKAFLANAAVGTTEAVPLANMLKRLDKVSGGTFTKALLTAGKETFEEAAQESIQTFANNYVAKQYYDKDRELLKDMAENAEVGGVTGFLFSAITQAISRRRVSPGSVGSRSSTAAPSDSEPGTAAAELRTAPVDGIDPAAVYKLTDEERTKIAELAKREAAGEGSDPEKAAAFFTEVEGTLNASDPLTAQRRGLYRAELERAKTEAAPATTEPTPEPSESDMDYGAGGEMPWQSQVNEAMAVFESKAKAKETSEPQPQKPVGDSKLPAAAPTATPSVAAASALKGGEQDGKVKNEEGQGQKVLKPGAVWQKLTAPPEVILAKVSEQKASVAVNVEAGRGKKAARVFEEFAGMNTEEDITELYKDRTAAANKSLSRKAAALISPDGSHVVIGSVNVQQKRGFGLTKYVTLYDEAGAAKSRPISDVLAEGWKLVGSIKFDEPVKNYAATYSTTDWKKVESELVSMRGAASRTAEKMGATISQGREFGRNVNEAGRDDAGMDQGSGDDKVDAVLDLGGGEKGERTLVADMAESADDEIVLKRFTKDHAAALFEALDGKTLTSELDVIKNIKTRRGQDAVVAAGRMLIDLGLPINEVSGLLTLNIYEAHRTSKSKEEFVESLLSGVRSEGRQDSQKVGAEGADQGRGGASAPGSGGGKAAEVGKDAGGKAQAVNKAAAVAAASTDRVPTEKEKESGDYVKGSFKIDGLKFQIENAKGSVRAKGEWSVVMPAHYGEIVGTEGTDGDPVDAYVGPNPGGADKVWVVDQIDPKTKKFDEHKALVGFSTKAEAQAIYEAGFSDGSGKSRMGAITEMSREEFADWVNEGDTKRPLAFGKPKLARYSRRFDNLKKDGTNNPDENYTPERLPPEAERGISQGGIQSITDVARGVHAASRSPSPRTQTERSTLERAIFKREEAALEQWAVENGRMLDSDAFWKKHKAANEDQIRNTGEELDGAEHQVYPEGGYWYKANEAEHSRTWLRYFHRLALIQTLFPETAYEFLGFIKTPGGKLAAVTRQKSVEGRPATVDEISAEMKKRGYERVKVGESYHDYYNPRTGIVIGDLHTGNAVVTKEGRLAVFDAQPFMAMEEDFRPSTSRSPITGETVGGGFLQRFPKPPFLRYREETRIEVSQARAADTKVAAVFRRIVDAARALGIESRIVKQKVGELVNEFGVYEEFEGKQGQLVRLITLSMADANNPTTENLVTLIHEVGHALMDGLSAKVQAQLHTAIRNASNEVLGISEYFKSANLAKTEALKQEERIVEAVANRLVASGFDPVAASGFMQSVWRLLKAIYLRTAMKLAELFKLPLSQKLALTYVQNRMEAGLARDYYGVLSFAGGIVETRPDEEIETEQFDLIKQQMRIVGHVSDEAGVSPDQNASALAERDVASHNEINAALDLVYRAWDAFGHNTAGMTFDQFIESGNFIQLENLPAEEIARLNQQLANAKLPPVNPGLRLAGVTNDSMKQRAALNAHATLEKIRKVLSDRRREADRVLPWLVNRLNLSNAAVSQLTRDYDNAGILLTQARDSVKIMMGSLKRSVGKGFKSAAKFGKLEQVISQLEANMTEPLAAEYERVINGLYAKLSTSDGGNMFVDMLDRVTELAVIDWKNDSAKDIRDSIALLNDPLLAPLSKDTKEGKAMMALTIAFGKDNAMMMDLLQLRKEKATDEKIAVNKLMQAALSDQLTAIDTAMAAAAKLPKLAKLATRLLIELKERKARNRELLDEMHRERAFQDFHQDTLPILNSEMTKLEKVFGATTNDWQPGHGATMLVPSSVRSTAEQVAASGVKLNLKENTTQQIRGWLRQMMDWLDAVPVAERGEVWNTVKLQADRMAKHDIRWGIHEQIKGSFLNRMLAPLQDRLEFIGTPLARSAAARIRKMEFWQHSLMHKADVLGKRWENTEAEAMAALGIKRQDSFRQLIYNASLSYIEKRQDILASQKDSKVAEDMAVKEAMAYLKADPHTAALMNPKAVLALERHIRQTARSSEFIEANRKEMGLKLLDERPGYSIYRESIGASPFTIIRGLNSDAARTYKEMQTVWVDRTADEVAAAYHDDPNALRAELARSFPAEVWRKFLKPIAYRTGRASFYAPTNPDGTNNFAMRERVIKAYENAGGDVVKFAENLFQLEGGVGDPAQFIGETFETLQSFYDQLRMVAGETEEVERRGLPTPRRYLADARKSEEFPAEWLDYMPYDVHSLRQMVKSQSYQAAYGRNLEAMRNDMAHAKAEQQDLVNRMEELQRANPTLEGKKLEAAMKAQAEAKGWKWTALKEAARNLATINDAEEKFDAFLSMNKTRPPEIAPWQEIVGGMAGAAVSGPGTALTDTVAVPEQAFRKFGLSAEALKFIGNTAKSGTVQLFGSLLQSFGVTLQAEARYNKLLLELGRFDPDAVLGFKQKFKATMSEHTNAGLLKPAVLASRAVRYGLSTGLGLRAKPDAEIVFPTAKPHSVFTWMGQMVNSAAIIGWWKRYETYVAAAVKHFEANPADLLNPAFRFKPKQFGLTERSYAYITNALAEYGIPSLEALGADAVNRRKKNPSASLLTKEQYRALAAQTQNAITQESGLTTRPPAFMTNPTLALANPMLGWAINKSYDAWRGFREPNGVASAKGFRTGLMAYAAILPIALAYALMRDWYDEEIIGRKGNVRDLTTIKDAPDAFLTMLDNTTRVGTFGVLGEVPNKWFNYDSQREVSLDNRIFFVSSALSLEKALMNWVRQGNADWATVGRPMTQALGGSGYLQYAGILNNALGTDNAEARVSNRISVNNYLRVGGRELGLDVRAARNTGEGAPNPVKPLIGQMVLAAYANDSADFRRAWREAIAVAAQNGRSQDEARDYVQRSFSSYHPLRTVFKTEPSENEYRRLLAAMNDNGRTTVATSINLFNHYGEQVKNSKGVGIAPNKGAAQKPKSKLTLEELRKRAAAR